MDISRIYGFPPVENSAATTLILGSMPGKASLLANEYYAHPQNAFWKIMGELTGASASLPYSERIEILQSSHIALWDVVGSCLRPRSLDADIDEASIVANDFAGFLSKHPNIHYIFFNGAKAEHAFRKYVLKSLDLDHVQMHRLPSTSPANASMNFTQKLAAWRLAINEPGIFTTK